MLKHLNMGNIEESLNRASSSFTTKSLKSMISKTNLRINLMKQIKEPSGKYTLFAFLSLK